MKKNIFIYFLILIVIGISITAIFISQFVQQSYKHESEEKLLQIAELIDYDLRSKLQQSPIIDYDKLAKDYSTILSKKNLSDSYRPEEKVVRITIINIEGKVLGESLANYETMENHLDRKEVQEALNNETGIEVHFSNTLKTYFIYTALLIKPENIVVRVSMPLHELSILNQKVWLYTLIGIAMGLFLTGLLAFKFSSMVTTPIDLHIKSINKELSKTVDDLKDKNIKMDAILNSMRNGIIAVDAQFKIMLINLRACEFFGLNENANVIGINIIELIRNKNINNLLSNTILENKTNASEVHVFSPQEKILRIGTAPIKAKDDSSPNSGGIIVVEDITNLKKLEQIRTEFVSNVTHELKTPLTSIKGFVETLKAGAIEDKYLALRFLDIVEIESDRLTMLINDILHLSEIENSQNDSNISIYSISEIIDEIIPILDEYAIKKKINVVYAIDRSLKLEVNKDRIKQLLINLIDNAIKYNTDNGSVLVTILKEKNILKVIVKDTGIGIAEENLSRIFERFYRVDKGRSRNMGGTGLGLSIVKHIVNLYNGEINVESTPGSGTEFIITLPVILK